jgi:hypothetical protein
MAGYPLFAQFTTFSQAILRKRFCTDDFRKIVRLHRLMEKSGVNGIRQQEIVEKRQPPCHF